MEQVPTLGASLSRNFSLQRREVLFCFSPINIPPVLQPLSLPTRWMPISTCQIAGSCYKNPGCLLSVISLWYRSCCCRGNNFENHLSSPFHLFCRDPHLLSATFSQGRPTQGVLWQLPPTTAPAWSQSCFCISLLGLWSSFSNFIQHSRLHSRCCFPWIFLPPSSASHPLCVYVLTQLYPMLWDLMGCSLLGSSVHGGLQARILEWVAIPFSRESSWFRDQTWALCLLHWQVDSLLLNHGESQSHAIFVPTYNLSVYSLAVTITDTHWNLEMLVSQQLHFNKINFHSQAGHVEKSWPNDWWDHNHSFSNTYWRVGLFWYPDSICSRS